LHRDRREIAERRLLATDRRVIEVVGDQHRIDLSKGLARARDGERESRGPGDEVALERTPTEGEAPIELIFIVRRHDRLNPKLASDRVFARLSDGDGERLGLLAMIVIANPDAILPAPRHDEIAMAGGVGLLGRRPHRVPFALAPLRPLGANARAGDAPGPGRL